MRTLCTVILLAAVGIGVLGYVRGWYTVVTSEESIDISIDRKKVEVDTDEWRSQAQKTVDEYRHPTEHPEGAQPVDPTTAAKGPQGHAVPVRPNPPK